MKTAYFKYQETFKGKNLRAIYGTVTLKNDGKISISLRDANTYSSSTRFQAKKLANEIVAANFEHVAVIETKFTLVNDSLIGILTDKTQDLKARWIEKTKEYVTNYWIFAVKKLAQPIENWYKDYDVKTEIRKQWNGEEYNAPVYDKNFYKMHNKIDFLKKLIKNGKAAFEAQEIKVAESHYANCIAKLYNRLTEKGLKNSADLKITSGWVGVNLEMIFEHNGIITKAWTIVAEGPIQRAHYRYLVK